MDQLHWFPCMATPGLTPHAAAQFKDEGICGSCKGAFDETHACLIADGSDDVLELVEFINLM